MVLSHNMTVTAHNKGLGRVKREFKQMMGLSPRCSDVETLQNIGVLYSMNGKGKKFNDYMDKFGMFESQDLFRVKEGDVPLPEEA